MIDTPFTNSNDQGVLGVFGQNVSRVIIETLRQINKNANVACSRTAQPESNRSETWKCEQSPEP